MTAKTQLVPLGSVHEHPFQLWQTRSSPQQMLFWGRQAGSWRQHLVFPAGLYHLLLSHHQESFTHTVEDFFITPGDCRIKDTLQQREGVMRK